LDHAESTLYQDRALILTPLAHNTPAQIAQAIWRAKGVLISPHVGGNTTAFESRARRLIESQLNLLASGKALENIIIEKK
jgi:phosphoglycerate dehydrogenase-like enzyme